MAKKSLQCRRCAVEIGPREDFKGGGWCYVCAPEFHPLLKAIKEEAADAES